MSFKAENISILVDYAHEPEGMKLLMNTLDEYRSKGKIDSIIHIYSATGSGRDAWKRPEMSLSSGNTADVIFITAEDHDAKDNLEEINTELEAQVRQGSRVQNVIIENDRKTAFQKALEYVRQNLADKKVAIVSTAMGSQQGMETAAGVIKWDERQVWSEVWQSFLSQSIN
ncbi:MAG: hypothetical protein OHK0017_09980 [Patescibacteria group bacterium]